MRRLRPGEIDPDPETKPARPDPVDMDEDEKEMLSEARARLANTQGKKAKRKAREKQLEEARRLASLQKRRELKAAGIEVRNKRKKRGMDYNADIPFHRKAPAGFWDVNDEKEREENEKRGTTNVLLQKLEGKRRAEVEDQERKKDAKRQKTKKESGEYVPPQAKRAIEQAQFSERKKLVLPAPQVGEGELEQIVKIGAAGENAKAIVDSEEFAASRGLLADYSTNLPGTTPLRTPRTPAVGDQLKVAARNLRAMEFSQTPLLGKDLDLEGNVSFEGATPAPHAMQTPNPLAAQLTPRNGASVAMTPRGNALGFGQTPLRDQMGINTPARSEFSGFDETPRAEKQRQNLIRRQLAEHFQSLPKPKNDFEIVAIEKPPADEDDDTKAPVVNGEEDMADVEARAMAARKAEQEARLKRRSQAVQRDLPRPNVIRPESVVGTDGEVGEIDTMIRQEMLTMLQNDAAKYPAPGQLPPPFNVQPLEPIPDDAIAKANKLLSEEFQNLKLEINVDEFVKLHERVDKEYVFVRGKGQGLGDFRPRTELSEEQLISVHQTELDDNRDKMKKEATRATKLEKRLGVVLGGYQARAQKLRRELVEKWRELEEVSIEKSSFEGLKDVEGAGALVRVERLRKEVVEVERRERELQAEYGELVSERDELREALEDLMSKPNGQGNNVNGEGVAGMEVDS